MNELVNNDEVMPEIPVYQGIPAHTARLNVTFSGMNGDMVDPVPFDASDVDLKRMAVEAIANGNIPGIPRDENVNLTDFVVDRFNATAEVPYNRLFIRPKVPFGIGG